MSGKKAELGVDTSTEADAILLGLLRQAPIWRKLRSQAQLNQLVQAMAMSSLRTRYPQASEQDLRRLLADRLLGSELARKAFGPRPDQDRLLGGL